jgi:hypothetical protein
MKVVYMDSPAADRKVVDYKMDKLPSKLRVWQKYAENFVKVLYQKTPFITIELDNDKD